LAKKVEGLKHSDCRNFISVDVAKGICGMRNEKVIIDTAVCDKFEAMPKCKNCACFTKDSDCDEGFGVCKADDKKEPWAFEELPAVTCEMYRAK